MFWAVTLGRLEQTAAQLPSASAKFAANPQLSGKYGGHTINLHLFARNGVTLLGRLVGVEGHCIALAPDLHENLTKADKASEDFKHEVDAFVRRTSLAVPEPESDPVDEVRSDVGRYAPAALDLKAAGISTVLWATGYGFDYSWVHLPVCDAYGFPVQQRGVTRFLGLYFLGMNYLYNRKSGILLGVGESGLAHRRGQSPAGPGRCKSPRAMRHNRSPRCPCRGPRCGGGATAATPAARRADGSAARPPGPAAATHREADGCAEPPGAGAGSPASRYRGP
jgi:hypothetical protein